MIRAQFRKIETRLMTAANRRDGLSNSIGTNQGTVKRSSHTQKIIKGFASTKFQSLLVLELANVPEKMFFILYPKEQILYTEEAEKRRKIIESFMGDLKKAVKESQERNELETMEEVHIGLNQEIDHAGMSANEVIAGFNGDSEM